MVSAAATNAATAMAERALIMTVPCIVDFLEPLRPVVSLGGLLTIAGFGRSSPRAENGFIGREFCFVARSGTKQSLFAAGTGPACRVARGALGRGPCPAS